MSPIEFLPAARRDLAGIFAFTERNFGRRQADRYVSLIAETCADLARGKRRPRNDEAIRAGLFSCGIKAHRAFCLRGSDGHLVVVRILHEAMNFEDHLQADE